MPLLTKIAQSGGLTNMMSRPGLMWSGRSSLATSSSVIPPNRESNFLDFFVEGLVSSFKDPRSSAAARLLRAIPAHFYCSILLYCKHWLLINGTFVLSSYSRFPYAAWNEVYTCPTRDYHGYFFASFCLQINRNHRCTTHEEPEQAVLWEFS